MSDHYWSIMEGSAVMTNLRCGPDFPDTPLDPDLPGRCQNQEEPEEPEEQTRAAVQEGRVYVKRIGHTKDEVYTQPFETRLRYTEVHLEETYHVEAGLGAGLGDSR